MWVKVRFVLIKQYNWVPMTRQYIYHLFIFKQHIPKFSQDTLLYFISKPLEIHVVLLYPILLIFQMFETWWCIDVNYELLQFTFENVLISIAKTYGSCYFNMDKGFLANEKAVIDSLVLCEKNTVLKKVHDKFLKIL